MTLQYDPARPLPEQVAEALKNYIIEQNMQSGDKLPTELTLSRQFGVSRSTIREAIRILESQNIVRVRQGSGSFIADHIGMSDDPLGLSFIHDKQKLTHDLLEIRTIIEPAIAELAARNATDEDIAELTDLYTQLEHKIMKGEDYIEVDMKFHEKIASASGNVVIPKLSPIIDEAINLFTKNTNYQLLQETLDTHRMMLDSIAQHNPAMARTAMLLHIAYNQKLLYEIQRQSMGLGPLTPKVPERLQKRTSHRANHHGFCSSNGSVK